MTWEVWLPPLLSATLLTPIVLYVGYYVVVPRVMIEGYRRGLPATKFGEIDGSEGAGSIDIEYFNLYYDVRTKDVLITGQPPNARHWQIGAFDGMTRLIDGAFINQRTVKLSDDGTLSVLLTSRPESTDHENVLDCSGNPRGMVILRIVLPNQKVNLPEVTIINV